MSTPPRPAPRRTYGRARPQVVDLPAEDTSLVLDSTALLENASPRQAQLNQFTAGKTRFLDVVKQLGRDAWDNVDEKEEEDDRDEEKDDDKDDAEAVKALMAKLKRDSAHASTSNALRAADSTSSLSTLPSSPPKVSSVLRRQPSCEASPHISSTPSPLDQSTPPTRRGRRQKRIIPSDDEADEGGATDRSATPSAKAREHQQRDDDIDDDGDNEDDEADRTVVVSKLSIFDDDSDGDDGLVSPVKSKAKGPKPLSKADQETLQRDIARASRNRMVETSRPETKARPVSAWMASARQVVDSATHLVPTRPSPNLTSDDIQQFTPSSGPNNRHTREVVENAPSSPTPGSSKPPLYKFDSAASLDDDYDDLTTEESLAKMMDDNDKQQRLKAMKLKALEANKAAMATATEDEDDLSIIPDASPKGRPKLAFTNQKAKAPDPRAAVLNRSAALAAPSKQHQQFMRMAGKKPNKKHPTETHIAFAGRQFGHADLRHQHGGARPPGQKPGRDVSITNTQLNAQICAQHFAQSRDITLHKEAEYGKGRPLPPKQRLELATFDHQPEQEDAVPESDESDEDYAPDEPDEVAEAEGADEADDEGTEEPSHAAGTVSDEMFDDTANDDNDDDDDDKENEPRPASAVDDDEETTFRVPRSRPSRRVAFSDDEDDAPIKHDTSLRDAVEGRTTVAPVPDISAAASPGFDIAFGSGSFGAGGFSQLFNQTQAPNDGGDAFAALREAPEVGLLPAHALLPSVRISETQKRRDNALVAGEVEEVERAMPQSTKKQQYLNSQGFFTQTRPPGREFTEPEDDAAAIEEDVENTAPMHAAPSSTLVNSSGKEALSASSPDNDSYVRLRRRSSRGDEEASDPETQVQWYSPPHKSPTKRNAFDVLHAGAQHAGRRAAERAQRSALVEEQAEESDEDNGWGFSTAKDGDEDEDDLDNGYVPDLLDDAKMTEEEKHQQKELVAAKFRQVEQEDDARREAEAKKVTEGHYRTKKRGNDFMSDEEDDEGKKPRLSKKQRRQRKLDREDGLYKLKGEANVFLDVYNEDLESDNELEEAPPSPGEPMSPEAGPSGRRETIAMLRARARTNHDSGTMMETYPFATEDTEDTQYAISSKRTFVAMEGLENELGNTIRRTRTVESYSKYLDEETQNPRRNGGATGVSVVMQSKTERIRPSTAQRPSAGALNKEGSSSSSTRPVKKQASGILLDRTERFV